MGNQPSGQQTFPYNIGEESQTVNMFWNLQDATRKSDQKNFSLFSFDKKKNPTYIPVAQNCLRRLKTIKHPNIINFVDGIETDDQISIITEKVYPLSSQLSKYEEYPKATSWGIYQIATAIIFLNNSGFVHGNLKVDSIFVNIAGDWKLGGLELTCRIAEDVSILRNHFKVIGEKYIPPELTSGNFSDVLQNNKSNYDCWLLGCTLVQIFTGDFQGPQSTRNLKNIPKDLTNEYKSLVGPPNTRAFDYFLNSGYFRNTFIQTCLFLENISVKETTEKDNFFKNLSPMLQEIPENFSKYKILPELVKALDYGGGNFRVLNPILEIASKLTPEEYQSTIVPSLSKWFTSQDKSLRMNLLKNISGFHEYLSADLINTQIYPSVERCFRDENPSMREVAIRSVIYLVPKLDKETVKTNLLQHFSKLQIDQKPGIRTNTTICLGKISPYLPNDVREKVLAPAFSRALKDIFPPTRTSGLQAIQATIDSYPADQIVNKLFPAVIRLTIDPMFDIRVSAFKTVGMLIKKLDEHHQKMGTTNEEPKPTTNELNLTSPQGLLDSFGGWASSAINTTLTNVTNKVTSKILGEKDTPTPQTTTSQTTSSTSMSSSNKSNYGSNTPTQTNTNTQTTSNKTSTNNNNYNSSFSNPSNNSSGNYTGYKPPVVSSKSNTGSGQSKKGGFGDEADEYDDWDKDGDDWGGNGQHDGWDDFDEKPLKLSHNTNNNKNNNNFNTTSQPKQTTNTNTNTSNNNTSSNSGGSSNGNFVLSVPQSKTPKSTSATKKPKKEKPLKLSQMGGSNTNTAPKDDFGDWDWGEKNKKSTNTNTTQPNNNLNSLLQMNNTSNNNNFNTNNNAPQLLQPTNTNQPKKTLGSMMSEKSTTNQPLQASTQPLVPQNNQPPKRPTFVSSPVSLLDTPNNDQGWGGVLAPSKPTSQTPPTKNVTKTVPTSQPTSLDFLFADTKNDTVDDDDDGWGDF